MLTAVCLFGPPWAQIDPRMVQLSLIVKRWAKRRGINSAFKGTLSSYAYVILVIFFLQTRNPPVLPALQQIRSPKDGEHFAAPCLPGWDSRAGLFSCFLITLPTLLAGRTHNSPGRQSKARWTLRATIVTTPKTWSLSRALASVPATRATANPSDRCVSLSWLGPALSVLAPDRVSVCHPVRMLAYAWRPLACAVAGGILPVLRARLQLPGSRGLHSRGPCPHQGGKGMDDEAKHPTRSLLVVHRGPLRVVPQPGAGGRQGQPVHDARRVHARAAGPGRWPRDCRASGGAHGKARCAAGRKGRETGPATALPRESPLGETPAAVPQLAHSVGGQRATSRPWINAALWSVLQCCRLVVRAEPPLSRAAPRHRCAGMHSVICAHSRAVWMFF